MARKDLIEVLQSMENDRTRSRATAGSVASSESETPAPVAPEAAPVPEEREVPVSTPGRPRFEALFDPIVLTALVAAFALGLWFGRSGRPTLAAPDAGGSAPLSAGGPGASSNGLFQGGGASGLLDAANQYTVVAIEYDDTARGAELAALTVDHFRTAGLPVFAPLQLNESGSLLVVVGAAPTQDELVAVRDRVRRMTDAAGNTDEFLDAYMAPIDNLVDGGR